MVLKRLDGGCFSRGEPGAGRLEPLLGSAIEMGDRVASEPLEELVEVLAPENMELDLGVGPYRRGSGYSAQEADLAEVVTLGKMAQDPLVAFIVFKKDVNFAATDHEELVANTTGAA